ncbi:MAG TPA: heavy metal-associated domain-containing protein [Acidimicrobiales bacterium]|nr:heavy metal-associated domain-containing protein [Acidimicrobiales bacterium]
MERAASDRANPADGAAARMPGVVTGGLEVTGMHCPSCVALIEESLLRCAGVVSAGVDLGSAHATVAFDPAVTGLEELCAVVAGFGYGASPSRRQESEPTPS